jgi:hypothetical protein
MLSNQHHQPTQLHSIKTSPTVHKKTQQRNYTVWPSPITVSWRQQARLINKLTSLHTSTNLPKGMYITSTPTLSLFVGIANTLTQRKRETRGRQATIGINIILYNIYIIFDIQSWHFIIVEIQSMRS